MDGIGNENAAFGGEGFKPCGDVDPVAIDVMGIAGDVADMDTHAQRDLRMTLQAVLYLHRGIHRRHRVGEFNQPPVAHAFDDRAMVRGQDRAEGFRTQGLQHSNGCCFIRAHHPAVAHHVSGKNGGCFRSMWASSPCVWRTLGLRLAGFQCAGGVRSRIFAIDA